MTLKVECSKNSKFSNAHSRMYWSISSAVASSKLAQVYTIISALLAAINAQPMAIKAGDVVEHVTGWRDKVISVDRYIVSTENHGSYNQCMIGLVENGEPLEMVRAKEAAREFVEGLG